MHFVYCIYSQSLRKTYVGRTSDYKKRLLAHNHPSSKGYSKRYQPWVILFVEEYATLQEASAREQFYKTGKGRELIKQKLLQP